LKLFVLISCLILLGGICFLYFQAQRELSPSHAPRDPQPPTFYSPNGDGQTTTALLRRGAQGEKHRPVPSSPTETDTPKKAPLATSLEEFHRTAFYRTLITNNLFQPLGTTPVPEKSKYRLIGTATPSDGAPGGTALVENIDNNTIRILSLGSSIGDATVVDIQPKRLTLDAAGKQTTLSVEKHLWLKTLK